MKSAFALTLIVLLAGTVHGSAVLETRTQGNYMQKSSGTASFTYYYGCSYPACGKTASGYTAAMNQLSFGAPTGVGPGDACGRCFRVSGSADPYSSSNKGPFKSIVVKVNDLCPIGGNEKWCGQRVSEPTNSYGQSAHFDLCQDSGAPEAFFPSGNGALTGTYQEVPCSEWSGSDSGSSLWNGACLAEDSISNWPSTGCGNQGTAPA